MKVKFGNGVKDVPIREVTAANNIVPAGEENAYHELEDIPRYDPHTAKPLSPPRIQKYGAREFKDLSRTLKQQGYELTILYDPTEYLRKQAEELEAQRNLTAEKKRELEQKRREAEKAQMKAEILAELKEAGIIPSKAEKPTKEPKNKK